MRRWSALFAAAALGAVLATGGGATPMAKLQARQTSLAARERSAALDLYALESQLARTQERLAALRVQREAAETQLARLRIQLDVAWQAVYLAQQRLGQRIRQLYEHGRTDPVAVLLGAETLDEAITGLENLRSLAAGDRDLVEQVRRARAQLSAAKRRVTARAAALRREELAAAESATQLAAARAERKAYLGRLAAERGLTRREIARAQSVAREAEARSEHITVAAQGNALDLPVTEAAPAPAPVAGGQTLTVVATGYALRGSTATGIPTAWGVVAVDPSVIPLGTRMTIPGYGEGVAADTGSAVRGNVIDLWFPTTAQALAWGKRTVTITLH